MGFLMGFLIALLGLLAGGYLLGIGTACTVFRERQQAYEDSAQEHVSKPFLAPMPRVARVPVRIP